LPGNHRHFLYLGDRRVLSSRSYSSTPHHRLCVSVFTSFIYVLLFKPHRPTIVHNP
jgi:hypothetical protein